MMVWFSIHRETGVIMPGIVSPLRGREVSDIDFYVIRENTEGEYSPVGERLFIGTDTGQVTPQSVFTRSGGKSEWPAKLATRKRTSKTGSG